MDQLISSPCKPAIPTIPIDNLPPIDKTPSSPSSDPSLIKQLAGLSIQPQLPDHAPSPPAHHQRSQHSTLVSLVWRHIDPRKPNRHRKLLERTHTKLLDASSRQVHQILLLNQLLEMLSRYESTLGRFQRNSWRLHRCLIKWDALKARDRGFTRRSIRLSLDLQRFIRQMNAYFGIPDHQQVIVVEETDVTEGPAQNAGAGTHDQTLVDEGFVEIVGGTHMLIDQTATVHQTPSYQPVGLRRQLLLKYELGKLKYKLGKLKFKTQKFNQKFENHEEKKMKLKLKGNQCIVDMVDDGKKLLEINEQVVELVFELSLIRKN